MKKYLLLIVPPAVVGGLFGQLFGYYGLFITIPLAWWWGGYVARRWG